MCPLTNSTLHNYILSQQPEGEGQGGVRRVVRLAALARRVLGRLRLFCVLSFLIYVGV